MNARHGETTIPGDSESSRNSQHAPRIRTFNAVMLALAIIAAILAGFLLLRLTDTNDRLVTTHHYYEECQVAATDLREASNYLTSQARLFVVTGEKEFLDGYLNEITNVKRREAAVETIERVSDNPWAVAELSRALNESNALAERELYAMRLVADAVDMSPLPDELVQASPTPEDASLDPQQKRDLAEELLLGSEYRSMKNVIIEDVDECAARLVTDLEQKEQLYADDLSQQLTLLFVIVVLLVVFMLTGIIANHVLVMRPMRLHAQNISDNDPLELTGSWEVQNVVQAYNQIYHENHRRTLLLKHEAETDSLTGLLNRRSFGKLIKNPEPNIALLIIDVDLFKDINDTYGHEVGDLVLKKAANTIKHRFRASDSVCRIGGDEFAAVLTDVEPDMSVIIAKKLDIALAELADTSDGLPPATLSIGVAFSAVLPEGKTIYQEADRALYYTKQHGRNGYSFSHEIPEDAGVEIDD